MTEPSDEQIAGILRTAKRIAVVGLSSDPSRPSFGVSRYLIGAGYEIIPVNPKHAGEEIHGIPVLASLLDVTGHVDIVDLFRRSVDVPRPAREAIAITACTVWMQLGIRNDAIADEAFRAGLSVIQDRCIAIEHRRLISQHP